MASLLGLDKDSDADRSVLVSTLLGHAPPRGHLTRQQCEEVVQRYSTAGLLRPSAASSSGSGSGGGSGGGSTQAEWSLDVVSAAVQRLHPSFDDATLPSRVDAAAASVSSPVAPPFPPGRATDTASSYPGLGGTSAGFGTASSESALPLPSSSS